MLSSTRRTWIEIIGITGDYQDNTVVLHTEDVD